MNGWMDVEQLGPLGEEVLVKLLSALVTIAVSRHLNSEQFEIFSSLSRIFVQGKILPVYCNIYRNAAHSPVRIS